MQTTTVKNEIVITLNAMGARVQSWEDVKCLFEDGTQSEIKNEIEFLSPTCGDSELLSMMIAENL